MSLWVCLDCTTAFSVGAPQCPHCGSERHAEEHEAAALGIVHGAPVEMEEETMPKITRHEGPSVPPVDEVDEVENGEDVAADTEKSEPEPSLPSRARKTASRSKKTPAAAETEPE